MRVMSKTESGREEQDGEWEKEEQEILGLRSKTESGREEQERVRRKTECGSCYLRGARGEIAVKV